MRWWQVALLALGFSIVPAIVAFNILTPPPTDVQRLVDYALPPIPMTAGGRVLPAWRRPLYAVIITDDVGGNEFSRRVVEFLREIADPATLAISETDLSTSEVGRGYGKLVICVCRDIISAARNQLSTNFGVSGPGRNQASGAARAL